jgi:hypothetical protein
MARMGFDMHRTASTSLNVGAWLADATRPRRGFLYDMAFGSEATPADAAIEWKVERQTAIGTGTTVVMVMLDPGSVLSEADGLENYTIDGTTTADTPLYGVALNQRATYRWVASPGGELVSPSTASNGFNLSTPTISTGTPVITAHWMVNEE